ncbi:hypothetical protein FOZ63_017235, partial [Perkinsus olseni]
MPGLDFSGQRQAPQTSLETDIDDSKIKPTPTTGNDNKIEPTPTTGNDNKIEPTPTTGNDNKIEPTLTSGGNDNKIEPTLTSGGNDNKTKVALTSGGHDNKPGTTPNLDDGIDALRESYPARTSDIHLRADPTFGRHRSTLSIGHHQPYGSHGNRDSTLAIEQKLDAITDALTRLSTALAMSTAPQPITNQGPNTGVSTAGMHNQTFIEQGPTHYPPQLTGGYCHGCGQTPCAYPVSDDRLQREMKTVKALKAPEKGKFMGMTDQRSGLSFRLEVTRNCGRLSPIVAHHYLREYVSSDVHKSVGIMDEWPHNCEIDYCNSINAIWSHLITVYSGQSTSEKLLESWNYLHQGEKESVQNYINRVCSAQEELTLAGNTRSESEVRAKLRCGLRDQRLQSDMLPYNNAPLPAFIATMTQKVIDYDRQAGRCPTSGVLHQNQAPQFQLGWANPPINAALTPTLTTTSLSADLDDIFLNGVQAGPLPDGSVGCARGCKDPFFGHFAAACRSQPVLGGRRANKGKGKGKGKNKDRDSGKVDKKPDEPNGDNPLPPAVTMDGLVGSDEPLMEIYSLEVSTCNVDTDTAASLRGTRVQTTIPAQLVTTDKNGEIRRSAKVLIRTLWDSGASGNFLRYDAVERILGRPPICGGSSGSATLADGSTIEAVGVCRLNLFTPKCTATIMAFVVKDLTTPLVLGTPGLRALGARLDFATNGTVSITTGHSSTRSPEPNPPPALSVGTLTPSPFNCPPGRYRYCGSARCFTSSINSIDSLDDIIGHDHSEDATSFLHSPSFKSPVQPVVPPYACIHIDTLRDGRFIVDFEVSHGGLKDTAGRGWRSAVARAAKALSRLSREEQLQADRAINDLLASGYVGYMTLRDTARPPPPRVINNLYCNNALVKDSHSAIDSYLKDSLPVFIGAQFVFKRSATTPCRIVYDCRPVNGLLKIPTSTRWCLHKYLLDCTTHPVATFLDIRQAYNQLPPSTTSRPNPRPILVIWVSVAFGLGPSGGALELATAHVNLEAEHVLSQLRPPLHDGTKTLSACPPWPTIYDVPEYDYARPILKSSFNKENSVSELKVLRGLSTKLTWRDYVDDWVIMGHHTLQVIYCREVLTACANSHKFTFPPTKCYDTWRLPVDGATTLGYILTSDDRLLPKVSVETLSNAATKRTASQVLAGLYDPLGKFLESNMHGRFIWRKTVNSVRMTYADATKGSARGGLFPCTASGLDVNLTTPRKELHALHQAAKEASDIYLSCGLDQSMSCSITICTDSLINLQRLQWIAGKSKAEVMGHLKKRHMTTHDVDKLVNIRDLLLRITIPVRIIHIPSEVNLADAGSRCKPQGPDQDCLGLLQIILDSPNERPTYQPVPWSSPTCSLPDGVSSNAQLCPLSPRAGALPVPLPEDSEDQVPTLSSDEQEKVDALISDSVKEDKTFGAIHSFLISGTITLPFTSERLRRAATQYEIDENGQLYRIVLQRPDGSIVKQRVVGEDRPLLLKLVGRIHVDHHHLGARQLMLKVKEKYHFKSLPAIVRRCLRLCRPCVKANAIRQYNSTAGAHHVKDIGPLQVIGID